MASNFVGSVESRYDRRMRSATRHRQEKRETRNVRNMAKTYDRDELFEELEPSASDILKELS